VGPVCFVVGARPNFMKVAPVYRALREAAPELRLTLVHTGQHSDPEMSSVFLAELALPEPDVRLARMDGASHAQQTAHVLVGLEAVFTEERPSLTVVAGDVNSTLAGALAAAKIGIPVAHIESGLRSYDLRMPEEQNRRLTDHLSTTLLAHSHDAVTNLRAEGITRGVHLVGNTMIDSLLQHVDAARAAAPWRVLGLDRQAYGVVTLHRPALVDDAQTLRATSEALAALGRQVPLVFPVHPRTHARLHADGLTTLLSGAGVQLVPPLGYLTFLGLEAEALFVVTDSGGLQEETTALRVRCFTLRDTTERPVTITSGTNTLLGLDPGRLVEIPGMLEEERATSEIPLWDGRAGQRAAALLAGMFDAVPVA
jgi:UDP-N-acetylglucosamine 2-epimerase (non-hydrolysing)